MSIETEKGIRNRTNRIFWQWVRNFAFPAAVRDDIFITMEATKMDRPLVTLEAKFGNVMAALAKATRVCTKTENRSQMLGYFRSVQEVGLRLSRNGDGFFTLPNTGVSIATPMLSPEIDADNLAVVGVSKRLEIKIEQSVLDLEIELRESGLRVWDMPSKYLEGLKKILPPVQYPFDNPHNNYPKAT